MFEKHRGGKCEALDGVFVNLYNYCVNPPYNAELKDRARSLRKYGTISEMLLWRELRKKQLDGFHFCRQRPIGWYIADFYCGNASLVVEIDGGSHETKQEYDAKRDNYLKSLGIKVLRFHDRDVKVNLDAVLHEIRKELNKSNTPPE